jgi:putative acyl-CoA dehydrogenase
MRIAGAVDRAARGDAEEALVRRIALSVTKYWLCKRLAPHTGEALECLGGNGYVEESGMPRLYREAPLVSIWEGSGNVAALDTLRATSRQPEALEAFFAELELALGMHPDFDDALALLRKDLAGLADPQFAARRIVERMALLLQGALLLRAGDAAVADAFVRSRLAGDWGVAYGTLPSGVDVATILDRARVPD